MESAPTQPQKPPTECSRKKRRNYKHQRELLKTGAAYRIHRHYERLGIHAGWSLQSAVNLCQQLNCTMEELAELCCLKKSQLERAIYKGKFEPVASLHFAIIQSALVYFRTQHSGEPIMPMNFIGKKYRDQYASAVL